jgi:hypothetical protein
MDNGGYSMIKIRHQRQWQFQMSEDDDDNDLTTPSDVCARLHSNKPQTGLSIASKSFLQILGKLISR